jgi:alpha-ketoglutarate-dependent taurine dioxygenase
MATDPGVLSRRPSAQTMMPLVIARPRHGADLRTLIAGERHRITAHLHAVGAILFRDYDLTAAGEFEEIAASLVSRLYDDTGEHNRDRVATRVFTPVEFPADTKLLWHCENSFERTGPATILFCCVVPPARGGETPLVDNRHVYNMLPQEIREPFVALGVEYRRTYNAGLGRTWQQVFNTGDRDEVARKCAAQGISFEWRGDVLHTWCRRPGALTHPVTGEPVWFNQAQHWHPACLDRATRTSLRALFGETLPRDCRYGDGSPIPDAVMQEILAVYGRLEKTFPWAAGDLLLIDNLLVAHGRNPYRGTRKLLVAMGDEMTYDTAAQPRRPLLCTARCPSQRGRHSPPCSRGRCGSGRTMSPFRTAPRCSRTRS